MDTYYDTIAQGYDELHGAEQQEKITFIKECIDKDSRLNIFKEALNGVPIVHTTSKSTFLDAGCGSGMSSRYFLEAFPNLRIKSHTGFDPSKNLIRIAKEKDAQGTYLVQSAEDITYHQEFNIIISLTAIQNFSDIKKGLEQIKHAGTSDALYILTYLKKSSKVSLIEEHMQETFKIVARFVENKDIVFFCTK